MGKTDPGRSELARLVWRESDVLPDQEEDDSYYNQHTKHSQGNFPQSATCWGGCFFMGGRYFYNTNSYPEVVKSLARFIEGTPKVKTTDVVNSTFHKLAVHAAA